MHHPYKIGRRGEGFCLSFYDNAGTRHRISLGTRDAAEATRRAPVYYAEVTRPAGTTVADLWVSYLADMEGRPVTETMKHTWKALSARFGPLQADEITVAHCRSHAEERRAAGIKDTTIITGLGHLRMVVVWAKKRRLIAEVPSFGVPKSQRESSVI